MNEFERIKRNSQFAVNTSFTPHNILNNLNENQSLNQKQIKSLALKKKIIEYDIAKKEEAQNAELERYTSIINQSKNKMKKAEDSLRAMDKLILYAKIATIRDRQLKEKIKLEEALKKKDAKLELMMEIERLKELNTHETKEKVLKKQRKDGCRIIIDQIKDNERTRSLQKEMTHREGLEMIKRIKTLEEEDRQKAEKLKKRSEELYKEAIAANQEAIEEKRRMLLKEKENDIKIMQYKIEKDRQEEEKIKEKKRLQDEKEFEMQKLREVQEKDRDQEQELNLIRARREYESNERKEREKTANALMVKSRRIKDFLTENDQQKLDKEIKIAEQSKEERNFFEQIVDRQQKELDEEKKIKESYRKKLYEHNYQLRRQIEEKGEKEKINKIEKYEEGMKIKKDSYEYIKLLQEKKNDKINELINCKLKPSYLVDLKKFKIDQR